MKSLRKKRYFNSRIVMLVIVNVLIFMLFSILKPSSFFAWNNIKSILSLMTFNVLLVTGMTIVLIVGCIDLSVGSNVALTSVVFALSIQDGTPLIVAMVYALIVSLLCGLFNGLLVAQFKIAPFLVTMGSMIIIRGIATVVTQGRYITVSKAGEGLSNFGEAEIQIGMLQNGSPIGIPIVVLISLAIVIIAAVLFKKWAPLNRFYYVGYNPKAAEISGYNSKLTIIMAFVIAAFCCYICTILLVSSTSIGYANYMNGSEMTAIAAAVVGGATMKGGDGDIIGSYFGVLMLAIITNGFVILGGSPNWQQSMAGIILILAVAFDVVSKKISQMRRAHELRLQGGE